MWRQMPVGLSAKNQSPDALSQLDSIGPKIKLHPSMTSCYTPQGEEESLVYSDLMEYN